MSTVLRTISCGRAAAAVSASVSREPLCFLWPRWTRAYGASSAASLATHGDSPSTSRHLQKEPRNDNHDSINGSNSKSRSAITESAIEDGDSRPFANHRSYTDVMMGRLEKEEASAKREFLHIKRHHELKRQERGGAVPNWRSVLRDLESNTPPVSGDWHQNALRISISQVAAGVLLFGEDDNIWKLKERTGCHFEVLQDNDSNENTVIISGHVSNISAAAAQILRIAPDASTAEAWDGSFRSFNTEAHPRHTTRLVQISDHPKPLRFIRSEPRRYLSLPKRADQIERPPVWTTASFGFYVQTLTSMKKMSSDVSNILFEAGEESNEDMIKRILRNLFFDPAMEGVVSTSAFNDAMAYFMTAYQVEDVRQLFVRMNMLDVAATTETFNIMLRGCANMRDLANFHLILGMMCKHGCAPNVETWIIFLRTLWESDIRQLVVTRMKEKGLLNNPGTQKRLWEILIPADIKTSLERGQTLDEFMRDASDRYSDDWLTLFGANQILSAMSKYGLVSRCWDFIQHMHSRNLILDTSSYNAVLGPFRGRMNFAGAFEILSRMTRLQPHVLEASTYRILFTIARKARLFNTARVIWIYACLGAGTDHHIRQKTMSHIRTYVKRTNEKTRDSILGDTFEKFTYVFGYLLLYGPRLLDEDNCRVRSFKIPPMSESGSSIANRHISQMRKLSRDWVPARPLSEVLAEALDVDKEFRSSGALKGSSEEALEWLEAHALNVKLKHRVSTWGGNE
jgi:pentatricopeptide repeat protein